MKEHPQVKQLIEGVSPLSVFDCHSLKAARETFAELRKKYDFPFWAATEYNVRDIEDPDRIVPLRLNYYQHRIADTFLKRYFKRELGRYVISKSFGRVGVSTCVQAYILWRQIYHFRKHPYTCSASDISIQPLKTNLCRFLHRDIVPTARFLFLPMVNHCAFMNTYRNTDFIRGIDLGYVHFADMSRWHDPDGENASRVYTCATSAVLREYYSLVVLEGNVPKKERFDFRNRMDLMIPWQIRVMRLAHLSRNPLFLDHLVLAHHPHAVSHLHHIDLDEDIPLASSP